jgi:zinc protease
MSPITSNAGFPATSDTFTHNPAFYATPPSHLASPYSASSYNASSPAPLTVPTLAPQLSPEKNPWLAAEVQARSPIGDPITVYTLKNGHRIIIDQRNTNIISLRTFIDAGSIMEDAVYPSRLYQNIGLPSGIAHLDEHCHFLTTEHFPQKNSWSQTISSYGAYANASTDNEIIQHEMLVNREDLPTMLALHAESILHPLYRPEDIPQEKAAVLNEVALRTKEPSFKLDSKLDELLFDRPATQTGGKPIDVATTSADQLRMFYRAAYTPERMVTIISGKVDPAATLAILAPAFGNNANRSSFLGNPVMQPALQTNERRFATLYSDEWSNHKLMLGFPAPAANDFKDRMAMEFLVEALDGGPLATLPLKLVVQSHLAFHEHLQYEPMKHTGAVRLRLDCTPGQEQQLLPTTLNLLSEYGQNPLPPDTVKQIRERLVTHFKQNQDTVGESSEQMGSEALAKSLPYYLNYEAIAASITGDDLVRVARTYLNPQRFAAVYGFPAPPGYKGN